MLCTGDLCVEEIRFPPGLLREHRHRGGQLCVLLAGEHADRPGDGDPVAAGSARYQPPESLHGGCFGGHGGWAITVEASPAWIARVWRDRAPIDTAVRFGGGELPGIALAMAGVLRRTDPGAALAAEGLALQLFGELARATAAPTPSAPPPWLRAVLEQLESALDDPLSVATLAAEVGVSGARLARAARRHLGVSLTRYHQQLRIARACAMLRSGDTGLADVAAQLGFADQSHFGRVFKRVTGRTPAAFRRLYALDPTRPPPQWESTRHRRRSPPTRA